MKEQKQTPKARPLIFTEKSIRAYQQGLKWMTRRVAREFDIHRKMKGAPVKWAGAVHPARESGWVSWYPGKGPLNGLPLDEFTKKQYANGLECPHGRPGDLIWMKEPWATEKRFDYTSPSFLPRKYLVGDVNCGMQPATIWYSDELDSVKQFMRGSESRGKLRNSMFMPRWASRYTVPIVSIRPERLQDITEADILAEGVTVDRAAKWTGIPWSSMPTLHHAFAAVWDHINFKRAPYDSNPYVWVIEFPKLSSDIYCTDATIVAQCTTEHAE